MTCPAYDGSVMTSWYPLMAVLKTSSPTATGTSAPAALTSGYQWAFWVMVGVGIVGLIATLTLIRSDQLQPAPEPVRAAA